MYGAKFAETFSLDGVVFALVWKAMRDLGARSSFWFASHAHPGDGGHRPRGPVFIHLEGTLAKRGVGDVDFRDAHRMLRVGAGNIGRDAGRGRSGYVGLQDAHWHVQMQQPDEAGRLLPHQGRHPHYTLVEDMGDGEGGRLLHSGDIIVVSQRGYGSHAVLKFSQNMRALAIPCRGTLGALTNHIKRKFMELSVLFELWLMPVAAPSRNASPPR